MARRGPAVVLLTTALGLGVLAPAATADHGHGSHPLKHRQSAVEHRIHRVSGDLDDSSRQLRRATERLQDSQHALAVAQRRRDAAQERLAAARREDAAMAERLRMAELALHDATQAAIEGAESLAEQRVQVTQTVNQVYEQGDPQLLALSSLLRSGSANDLAMGQQLGATVTAKQSNVYADLDAAADALRRAETGERRATHAVAQRRAEAARHLVATKAAEDRAARATATVRERVAERRDARAGAVRARAHDRAALARLRAREAVIKRKILAAARKAAAQRAAKRIASSHGYLLRPVPGAVTSPFGWRIHPIYHYWGLHDGTDFGVSCGEPMRAAGSGTVISRYRSSVYGNRLYVNLGIINGKNVTVVYNHASGYRVGVGDHVTRGEVVGWVGDTGWSTGCHLHFTVLVNGTAVDPMNWL